MITMETAERERLLTLAEYEQLAKYGHRTELVRGKLIPMNPPFPYHGFVCGRVVLIIAGFVETNQRGQVMSNDSGVVTERMPDTVRGADFAFYSYQKVPKGSLKPRGYLLVVPDLIVEVKSPDDVWSEILAKVAEYHKAGVAVVCVLDPERLTATVYRPNEPEEILTAEDNLSFPQVLPGFSVRVQRFFE
jgi:Uma2 family endonuclease